MKRLITITALLLLAGCHEKTIRSDEEFIRELDLKITELEGRLGSLPERDMPKTLTPLISSARDSLATARASGDPYLQLYRLREAVVGTELLDFYTTHLSAASSQEAFETVWNTTAANPAVQDLSASRNELQLALAEAAEKKAAVLREASLAYSRITSPDSGLYYLSESAGNRRYAEFVRSLEMPADPEPYGVTSAAVARGIDRVEKIALGEFGKDITSRQTIPVSVRLKESRELVQQKKVHGALLALLEARLLLATNEEPASAPPEPGTARDQSSLERLFRTMAEREPSRSNAIRSAVLPLHMSLRSDAAGKERKTQSPVIITLVRWPYT